MKNSDLSIERTFDAFQYQISSTIMAQVSVTRCESARPLNFNEDEY